MALEGEDEEVEEEEEEADVRIIIQHPTAKQHSREFTIPREGTLQSAFKSFLSERGLLPREVTFKYDGLLVKEALTPKHYAMSNDDIIDAIWKVSEDGSEDEIAPSCKKLQPLHVKPTKSKVVWEEREESDEILEDDVVEKMLDKEKKKRQEKEAEQRELEGLGYFLSERHLPPKKVPKTSKKAKEPKRVRYLNNG